MLDAINPYGFIEEKPQSLSEFIYLEKRYFSKNRSTTNVIFNDKAYIRFLAYNVSIVTDCSVEQREEASRRAYHQLHEDFPLAKHLTLLNEQATPSADVLDPYTETIIFRYTFSNVEVEALKESDPHLFI